ncbi:Outer membrane protein MIP [Rubrivivax sp. A210]|uniref:FKBP-type peptidyl-prolyl cis-trans isomerase n=1 Tax=Rubrivivax sp. A210 TaxID=2772301 RepID=UPI00191B3CBB|nr:FKBP-type peptidyl-prolyl cis-trans isomerase [Rubrivivax sp. A210]CAD5373337.1 Outer membrane protein MIP [Rubrivivax sp. A210]
MQTKHSPARRLLAPLALAAALLACGAAQAQTAAAPKALTPTLAENKDKVSYATGVQAVRNFVKNDIAFDIEQMIAGMRDALAGKELAMNEREIRLVLGSLQADLRRNMAANQKGLGERNLKRGSDFLAGYKGKPGTQALSNGVAYRVLQQGSGPKPSEGETVIVKYRGTNIDGIEFDGTDDGKTALLRVNQVIMGWREALKQMPSGAKWEIVIPPTLAYGERGVGTTIGPNETLVFEVELVGIKPI